MRQPDPTTVAAIDPIEHFIEARPLRQPAQLSEEVLLQRLTSTLGPTLQRRMDIVGEISNQHIGHAYILLSQRQNRNPRKAVSPDGVCQRRTYTTEFKDQAVRHVFESLGPDESR